MRYADDFVVLVSGNRDHADDLCEQVGAVLAPMGLNLSAEKKERYLQADVGHFGVFNGSRFRLEIAPRI